MNAASPKVDLRRLSLWLSRIGIEQRKGFAIESFYILKASREQNLLRDSADTRI